MILLLCPDNVYIFIDSKKNRSCCMGLMDAPEYDPKPETRRKMLALAAVVGVVVILAFYFMVYPLIRNWPEERVVNQFFQSIEQKDFEKAYGFYFADPDWKQHPDRHPAYTFNQFYLDWGPGGEYGQIAKHHVDCSKEPDKKGFIEATGVVVVVTINDRHDVPKSMWVEKKSKEVSTSPLEGSCQ